MGERRSLISYDEGFRDGVRKGVEWAKNALTTMRDENDMQRTMGEGMDYPCDYEKVAEKVLALAIDVMGTAPVDGPFILSGGSEAKPLPARERHDDISDRERLTLRNVAYRARALSERLKRWSYGVFEYDSAEHMALGEALDVAASFMGHTGSGLTGSDVAPFASITAAWDEPQLVAIDQLADRLRALGVTDCALAARILRAVVSERRRVASSTLSVRPDGGDHG